MRYVSWVAGCILVLGAGLSYAGQNEGAVISFDLEWDGLVEKGNQRHVVLDMDDMEMEPEEPVSVVLSVYADGVSNLCGYEVIVRFDTTRVSFEKGGYMNVPLFEFDVFSEAELSPMSTPVSVQPKDRSTVGLASGVDLSVGDEAPDGDDKFLGWIKFTTLDSFEGEARFSLALGKLMDPDKNEDEVSVEGVAVLLKGVAVEPYSWGRIKAAMGW